ncbi:MAG: hypothetical protein R3E90_12135 [Marinicella sp.]
MNKCTTATKIASLTMLFCSFVAAAQETMPLPGHSGNFNGNARGYWFTAPEDFTVVSLRVPDDFSTNPQSIEFIRFNSGPPPLWSSTTNDFTSLFRVVNDPTGNALPVALQISNGDHVGVLGVRGDVNSYATAPYVSQIGTHSVTLTRMGMQFFLSSTNAQQIFQESGGSLSRVEITYLLGTFYGVRATVNNLNGNLVLQNNSGDNLTVTQDGTVQFDTLLADTENYDVTVFSQPANQVCTVSNGVGTITSNNADDIQIDCESMYIIAGSVDGLISDNSMTLQNNLNDDLIINDNGVFIFSEQILNGTDYDVTILNQPDDPIQNCMVQNGMGTIANDDVTDIMVSCEFGTDLIYRHGFDTDTAISPPPTN